MLLPIAPVIPNQRVNINNLNMIDNNYIYIIVALLPLTALMLVFQKNPYHALVIRAILGAIAALVYVIFGAADVALTEALVGTMLAVTLYVIAVRSSLVMRLGIVEQLQNSAKNAPENYLADTLSSFKKVIHKYHLRLELVEYPNAHSLNQALINREVHGVIKKNYDAPDPEVLYQTAFRVQRLFEIMQTELTAPQTTLIYTPAITNEDKKH